MRSIARTGLVAGFAAMVCTVACLDNASIGPSRVLTLDGLVQDGQLMSYPSRKKNSASTQSIITAKIEMLKKI